MKGKYEERFVIYVNGDYYTDVESHEKAIWFFEGLSQFHNDVRIVRQLTWAPILDLGVADNDPV